MPAPDKDLGYAVEHCGKTKPAMPAPKADTIRELIAATKRSKDHSRIELLMDLDDKAQAALPALQAQQDFMEHLEEHIGKALERLHRLRCKTCTLGFVEEISCNMACGHINPQDVEPLAALLAAELLHPQPTEENPIKPIATIELKPLGEIRRGTIKELESEEVSR